MTRDQIDHARRLTGSLVALAERGDDYRNNAEFRHSVDILVRLLPFMVNGIGIQAEAESKERQAIIEQLMSQPFQPINLS